MVFCFCEHFALIYLILTFIIQLLVVINKNTSTVTYKIVKMSKKGGHVCAAKNCSSSRSKSKGSFFTFPKDSRRARVWALACGRDDLLDKLENLHRSYRVCGFHFETRMFLNDLKNRLQPNAVPTIFPSLEESPYQSFDHTYAAFKPHIVPTDESYLDSTELSN